MKIALIGYGKMGKEVENIALEQSHEIIVKADIDSFLADTELFEADVAIEFSTPDSAVDNIFKCFNVNVPVVVGTTGWMDRLEEVKQQCLEHNQSLFYASNFSVGVNIFFEINKKLAEIMNGQISYDMEIDETHHKEKVDAPSGTAITLANEIVEQLDRKTKWVNDSGADGETLKINSFREDQVPGTHSVTYESDIDKITISHVANNRRGFAAGAVMAAEWLMDKKGVFTMNDLLKL